MIGKSQDYTHQKRQASICVIGGGPAGSSIAYRLALLGHEVCIVECQKFPRHHIGLSLPLSIIPLLDSLGMAQIILKEGFIQKEKVAVWWTEPFPTLESQPGFHVDRGRFDQLLLKNATNAGASLLQPARATHAQATVDGQWAVNIQCKKGYRQMIVDILVDASGRNGFLKGKQQRIGPPLTAMYGYWSIDNSNSIDGCLQAGENAWYWSAYTGEEEGIAAVYTDPKEIALSPLRDLQKRYLELLTSFSLFDLWQKRGLMSKVLACDATSRVATTLVEKGFIRVGDACSTLDPLSSQGVQTAIVSSLQAAAVVHTMLTRPTNTEDAIEFYKGVQHDKVARHKNKTSAFYQTRAKQCDHQFWQRWNNLSLHPDIVKSIEKAYKGNVKVKLSKNLEIKPTPVMRDDFIEKAPALYHPSLSRPVTYVAGVELPVLLTAVYPGQTLDTWFNHFSRSINPKTSKGILQWLLNHNIVEYCHEQ